MLETDRSPISDSEVVLLLQTHVPFVQVAIGSRGEPYLSFRNAAMDERFLTSLLGYSDQFAKELTAKSSGAHAAAVLSFQLGKVLAILALAVKLRPSLEADGSSIGWRLSSSSCGAVIDLHLARLVPVANTSDVALVLHGWLQPFVVSIAAKTGIEPIMLWRLVADSVALAFEAAGVAVGNGAQGRAAGLALVRDKRALFYSPDTDFICMSGSGSEQDRYFLRRAGCCLAYQAPGGSVCDNCGLLPTAVQRKRLAAFVDALPPA